MTYFSFHQYPRLLSTDKHHTLQSNQNHHHQQQQQHHHLHQNNHTHSNHVEELIPMTSTSHGRVDDKTLDLDVNLKGISDLLMSTRVPESCV